MSDLYNPGQAGFNDGADFLLNSGYVLGGTHDPSSIATYGAKGAIWVQVAQYGIGTVGIFQKQDDGKTTNWTPIGGGSNAYTPAVPSDWKLPLPTTTQEGLDQAAEFINFQSEYFIYADAVSGSDVDGDGSVLRPFQTIQAAIAAYAAAVGVGNYCLKLNPGDYGGAPVAIPSQVNKNLSIEGTGSSVNISAVLSFTSAGLSDEFLLMSNVSVQNPFDIDLSASSICLVFLNNGGYTVNRIDSLPAGPQFVRVVNSVVPYFQTNSTVQFVNCLFVGGPPSVVSATGNAFFLNTIFSFMNATVDGNIAFYASVTGGSVLSGAGTLTGDATSLNPLVSTLPGLVFLDKATEIGYTPSVPANWSVVPTQVQEALDELAANAANSDPITFVYQPGGTPVGNIYDDWTDLYAAVLNSTGPCTIYFDDSIVSPAVIPAGAYPFPSQVTFENYLFGETTNVEVSDGVSWTNVVFINNIVMNFLNSSPVETLNNRAIRFNGAEITANGTSPIWETTSFALLQVAQASALIGTVAASVVSASGGATLVMAFATNTPSVPTNQYAASGAIADSLLIFHGDSSGPTIATQTNFLGTISTTLLGNSFIQGYAPTTPADWSVAPNNVGAALDELAARPVYNEEVIYHTITGPEAAAKQITLLVPTTDLAKVILFPVGGVPQNYSVDYVMLNATDLSWNGLGLDGILAAGDVLLITYPS